MLSAYFYHRHHSAPWCLFLPKLPNIFPHPVKNHLQGKHNPPLAAVTKGKLLKVTHPTPFNGATQPRQPFWSFIFFGLPKRQNVRTFLAPGRLSGTLKFFFKKGASKSHSTVGWATPNRKRCFRRCETGWPVVFLLAKRRRQAPVSVPARVRACSWA